MYDSQVEFVLSPEPGQFYAMVPNFSDGLISYEGKRYDAYNVNFLGDNQYEVRWQVGVFDIKEIKALEALQD